MADWQARPRFSHLQNGNKLLLTSQYYTFNNTCKWSAQCLAHNRYQTDAKYAYTMESTSLGLEPLWKLNGALTGYLPLNLLPYWLWFNRGKNVSFPKPRNLTNQNALNLVIHHCARRKTTEFLCGNTVFFFFFF